MLMRMRAVFACLVALPPLGCASLPPRHALEPIALDELLAGAPLGASRAPVPGADLKALLSLSDEMRAFLNERVSRSAGRDVRVQQLAHAIVGERRFGLEYDETTRTASETFQDRRGNCLSFSTMFVAMARHVGLVAHYQEVDTPPDWSMKREALVLNRHVNVVIDLRRDGERVVDFNMEDFRTTYDRRRIPDTRALAHYYNNLAVERMQAGDAAAALAHFRSALQSDGRFSPAWTNLGMLYLRGGHFSHAEAALLQALSSDKRDLVAMSNLASLYDRLGDRERGEWYRRRVAEHRRSNPYYRFQLAREAFAARDYDASIDHLMYAYRRKSNDDRFCFLLGMNHMMKGNQGAARRWLSRAEKLAATDALKRQYSSKIEMLLSGSR
jgi:Tfp pilus assembly protein PilF